MTRYETKAAQALRGYLAGKTAPVSLYTLSCVADAAARQAGKVRDLYDSLYAYERLLPSGWRCEWLTVAGGTGDRMLMAVPPGWQPGSVHSDLLLGCGPLVPAALDD